MALRVLWIGSSDRAEFQLGRQALGRWAEVREVADGSAAETCLSGGEPVEVLLLAPSYPQQFSGRSVETLRRLAPLARVVGLLGPWCEGEGRSGRPWPGVVRYAWHQWPALVRQIERLASGAASVWDLPDTATDEERLLATSRQRPTAGAGLVAVWSRQGEAARLWLDACRAVGYSAVWSSTTEVRGAVAALVDAQTLDRSTRRAIGQWATSVAGRPVLVLLDYPRPEDVALALRLGATAVLAKPLTLDDVYAALAGRAPSYGASGILA